MKTNYITIDGRKIQLEGEKNLLEVIRKAKIDLPTFCYHSELSAYGACRLCMVEIEGRGIQPACSTPPAEGMVVKTITDEIREMRKIIVELLLARDGHNCTTCGKSTACQLQSLAKKLGITKVRFKAPATPQPVDETSPSLIRDPNKCVLCGDCVRVCSEIQGIGAIDFAYRGSKAAVMPAFNKTLEQVDCVYCGQCARVCPTGALTAKPQIEYVWKAINDKKKTVVAQIAPAVRIAVGEMFGLEAGTTTTGQIVAALRSMGFDKVFDTAFSADLTVIEETTEFLNRLANGGKLPQFTSCCPGWVKFVEQYYPEMTDNLSTCKSPQQMFGSVAKELLAKHMGIKREDLVVVSIMPCTAKKFEAKRPEFITDGNPDVDFVLTTQELGRMIEEAGLRFRDLEPESFDMPLGFQTGAGVIFGNSGGVSEAVLRYATEKLGIANPASYEFTSVRGSDGIRETTIKAQDKVIRLAIVNGLANAKKLLAKIKSGEAKYDLVEVMACPGGCIGGGGQPVSGSSADTRRKRTAGLYENDRMLKLHKSQENPYITELYETQLGKVGGDKAHHLLHTHYNSRKRIDKQKIQLTAKDAQKVQINVCFGTGCFLKGAQTLFHSLLGKLDAQGRTQDVDIKASFCFERCNRGPVVRVGEKTLEKCTVEKAMAAIEEEFSKRAGEK